MNKYWILWVVLWLPIITKAEHAYKISAELIPQQRSVAGHIEMIYQNTSQDTLNEVWVHLWPNAYSHHHTPWARQVLSLKRLDFHDSKIYGSIDSLSFSQDGEMLSLIISEDSPDVGVVNLKEPLLPGQTAKIETSFMLKLPKLYSRSGYDGSFYSVTQWYPKFAVYENGEWEFMSYLDQGEFYSDFASYDVKITLPTAYHLAATAHPYIEADTTLDSITYHIQQDNIHDFAWFASRKFEVHQRHVALPSGRIVLIQAYTHHPQIASRILDYTEATLKYMSQYVGEYPYEVYTIVEGMSNVGAGMEYPTIATVAGGSTLKEQVVHEVVHNWWYGILANNERQEPYIDEAFTSYYEARIIQEILNQADTTSKSKFKLSARMKKRLNLDRLPSNFEKKLAVAMQYRLNAQQPSNLHSEGYSAVNYYTSIYAKGTLDIQVLEHYLGRENLDELIQAFYQKNKFKHISIQDLRSFLEKNTTQDVSWFFDGLIAQSNPTQLKIKRIQKQEGGYSITLQNKGSYAIPSQIGLVDKDLQVLELKNIEPFENELQIQLKEDDSAHAVLIDPDWLLPERNRTDNYVRLKGIKKMNPLQFKFLAAAEDPTKTQLFYTPVLAGNQYDGFMLGMALYNRVFPAKKLEFELLPFYAFKSKKFNWIGNVSYRILPQKQKPVEIEIGVHSKSFSRDDNLILLRYTKLQLFVTATFHQLRNPNLVHQLGYRNIHIWNQDYKTILIDSLERRYEKKNSSFNTHEVWYSLQDYHAVYPKYLKTVMRFDKNYWRQSLEYKQDFRYSKKGAFFRMRVFAGAFYYWNKNVSYRSNAVVGFNMSGIDGRSDYLYEGYYFGRSTQQGFSSRQMLMGEGNFKVMTPSLSVREGKTVNGLLAVNLKMDAPVKWLPLQLFFDAGYSIDKQLDTEDVLPVKQFHYDFGFNISLFNEGLEVYFPLLMSKNFKTYYQSHLPKFGQRITFSINMDKLNLHKQLRSDIIRKVF